MLRILLIVFLFMMLPFSVGAEQPPVPPRKTDLGTIQKNLEQEKQTRQALQTRLKDVKKELDSTRSELVKIAENIQSNENELALLEKRIARRQIEEKALTEKLEQNYGTIADLILALERIRRIPPESLIVRPGAPLQTAQSAMLLQSTLPAVNKRAKDLSADLEHLGALKKGLEADRTAALTVKSQQKGQYASMQSLVKKRENLYSTIQKDYEQNKQRVAKLTQESKTLMELINRLEKEQQTRQMAKTAPVYASLPEKGVSRLPVSGSLIEPYGHRNAIGATSQGVTLEAAPGALVVAPMGGVVRFSGVFKNYGNMVIIEHKNGYHSLIAGLQRIDAQPDHQIKSGEPIGQLPLTSSRGGQPALYYELRLNGQPVNPASAFSELKT